MESIKILIVDDHGVVRDGLVAIFGRQTGFIVIGEAVNGVDAVQKTMELQPDVILMDLRMPVLNGVGAMKRIREQNRHVEFIVLTTFDSDEFIFDAIDAGAKGYLLKDATREELFQSVRAVHRGESLIDPGVAAKVLERLVQLSHQSERIEDTNDTVATTPTISTTQRQQSVEQEAFSLIKEMESISLSRFSVVPGYSKYDEQARNVLKDARQKIVEGFRYPGQKRENHLIWAAPGSGKTYFVQQVHSTLPERVEYHELNLAKLGQSAFNDALRLLDQADGPCLCLVDEIDSKPTNVWPYEMLLPYLDSGVDRGAACVFLMAGSAGSSVDDMKQQIAARPKGADLLSRVPGTNEYEIPSMGTGDRLLVAMSQFRHAGEEAGKDVQSVEKLGLYYIAIKPLLANARQLREFAVRAVQRMPMGEDRIKYDHLFSAGDPENKSFWSGAVSMARDLENRFVAVED